MKNLSDKSYKIEKGKKIGQVIFTKVEEAVFEEVEELSATTRNEDGFGSTGLWKRWKMPVSYKTMQKNKKLDEFDKENMKGEEDEEEQKWLFTLKQPINFFPYILKNIVYISGSIYDLDIII